MSIKTTICPRCESKCVVHLPECTGVNQWICNQCSHQWDFASPEERALVPRHLKGSRIEQFLEEFLAIKVVTRGQAEKIWNCCANAYQATSCAGNEDKPRVFAEQVDQWRDQLIRLQETLIIDRLLPLVAEYQIPSNEQIWLFQTSHEAWSPVTAGFLEWFSFALRGQLYGAGPWLIPEWAWQLRGAPRNIAHLDVTLDEKASALLHCLAGTLERELVVHRKSAIAKAFLAAKTARSSTVGAGRGYSEAKAKVKALQAGGGPCGRLPGRPLKLTPDFVQAAGKLWRQAQSQSAPDRCTVTAEKLVVIASSLDSKGYTPPAEYLERNCAADLKKFNSNNSNSKTGPIRTWGTSEQPSILKAAGISAVHRPRISLYCLRPYRNPPFTRLSETLPPRHRQPFAVQVQVHQRKAGAQPMMVLLNPSVSHLLETEDALQNPEWMFHLRSHSGLHPVLGLL
jgi:hypothetical protein